MKKIFTITAFVLVFLTTNHSYPNKVQIIAKVNDDIITNVDLFKEYQLFKIFSQTNVELNNQSSKSLLKSLINHQIKKSELNKYNININKRLINDRIKLILESKSSNIGTLKDMGLYDFFFERVEIEMKWIELIKRMFRNKVNINTQEVENKIEDKNSKDLSEKDYNNLIMIEKNKKMSVYNKTYFNEIKLNYLVNVKTR